jgi:hypothetical protein
MHFCEWKDDCQQCSKMTYNRDCASRDFCVWDQGTLPKYPVTGTFIAFRRESLLGERVYQEREFIRRESLSGERVY